jgi:putative ATP-binding cassette transporter
MWVSWALSGTLLLLILLNLATSYGMNVWTRSIFDALQKRDSDSVLLLSMVYLPLLAASVFFSVMQVYARMTTQRRWREWLNNHLVDRWLKNGRYYQLNLMSGGHKNPEYRVADDVRVATESPVDFVTGMTAAILSATTFVVVLWTIGGALTDMTITSTWLSRYCCSDLCPGGEQLHGGHRALLRQGVGG